MFQRVTVLLGLLVCVGFLDARSTLRVPCGSPIQPVLDDAKPESRVELDPGCTYEGSIKIRKPLTLTTRGWQKPGDGWAGTVTPEDRAKLATIAPTPREAYGIDVPNGPDAGGVRLVAIAISACAPAGACDQIRIGSGTETKADDLVADVVMQQVFLAGDPEYGSKRGIAANGRRITITQSWCQDIFLSGQDAQCVNGSRGSHDVEISYNYLQAGTENIMVGGNSVPNAEMAPRRWKVHHNILHKPKRWFPAAQGGDGRDREVKNLFELKHGDDIQVYGNLMVGNFAQGQDGTAILIHYTTQYTCPECVGLTRIVFRDNVILDAPAGISLQGYSHSSASHNAQKLRDVLIENNYVWLNGSGRPLKFGNVLGEHDVRIVRNSFRSNATSWFYGFFGRAWTSTDARVTGGPMQGLQLVGNLVARSGTYGITAPDGSHGGSGIEKFVRSGLEISGNVLGDAPPAHIAAFNKHQKSGEPNRSAPRAAITEALTRETCGSYGDAGADCARLAEVFALLKRLPEP